MVTLILKDLRVAALMLWLVVPIYATVALGSAQNGQAHFWLTVALAFGLMMLVPGIQWYQGSDIFVSTLPVDRALLVRGRFATSGVAVGASLLAGAYPAVVLGTAGSMVGRGWPIWLSVETGIEFVLVAVIVMAVSHPVLFRWGPGYAAAVGGLGVLALSSAALMGGHAPGSLQTIDPSVASPLAPLVRLMVMRAGLTAALAVSALLAIGLVAASLWLSLAWARDQEF